MGNRWKDSYQLYLRYLQNIVLLYQKRQDVRMYLEVVLSLFTIAIFGAFAIRPTITTILQIGRDIQSKKEIIETMDRKIEALIVAEQLLKNEEQKISILNSAIPEEPPVDKIIRQIEGLAQKNASSLISIAINEVTILGAKDKLTVETQENESQKSKPLPEGVDSFSLSLTAAGNYPALASFISDLENMRSPIFIDSITIGENQTETGQELQVMATGRITFTNKDE